MTRKHKKELLDAIAGRGHWQFFGSGFHTYPNDLSENQQKIHNSCVELEQQGLITRRYLNTDHCIWSIVDEN